MNISDLLAWSARRYPEEECVVEVDPGTNYRKSLTYKQFDRRINMVSNALLDAGIKKGDRVLHFMKNRIEWMESYFGIIRIGAVVIPLNFRFTGADLEYVAKIVEPSITIVEDELLGIVTDIDSYKGIFGRFIFVGNNVPEEMTKDELFEWCREMFSTYNRPRRIEFGEIPKSPTNKVLKHELRLKYGGKKSAF